MQHTALTADQQLVQLRKVLASVGSSDAVDHSILYPGHRRQDFVRNLLRR
jgi:hypothetical protein